jgi:PAS domain S-box-containing protein
MPDMIAVLDTEHRIVRANLAMRQKLERDGDSILGQHCYQLLHNLDAPPDFCLHERLLKDGESHAEEIHLPELGGYYSVTVTPLHDAAGDLIGSVHISRDVTVRKQAEDALRESEELLRETQLVAGLGSYCLDMKNDTWTSSDILDGIFGIDESFDRSVSGWVSLIHPEEQEMMNHYFTDEVVGKRLRFNKEYRIIRHDDGRECWVHGMGRLEFNEQGQPVGMIGTIQDITQRKQNEEIVRASEEQFRLLFEKSNDAIFITMPDNSILSANPESCRMFGMTSAELCRADQFDIIDPSDDRFMAAFERRTRSGEFKGELNFIRKNGEVFPANVSSNIFTDSSGNIRATVRIEDISKRKQLEEKITHANNEWRRTFDTIPDMITIVDNEYRIVRANRAAWQKLGCKMQDLIGKPCYTMFHGIDSPPEFCPHAQLLQDGLTHSVEIFETCLNGYVDVTVTPLCEPDGTVIGSIHIAHDITELKQAGEALLKSEMLYRTIITASPDNITITDLEGCIRMVSPKGLAMFGYEQEEEVLGRSIVEFVVPEDRERTIADFMLVLQGSYTWPGEYRALRADGNLIMIEVNGAFILDTDGQPESIILAIREITERKRVEDELNRKNAEIEQFIYTVSHDLRSPLVTIKTFLGYLGQDISTGDSDRIDKDIEFMHTASDRMEALLNELLDFSQVGRTTILHESITFQELVAEALDAVAGQISAGKVDVKVSAANPTLHGDRRRLLQVWQNLLDNALKYTGDQALPCVEVGIEQQQGETVFIVCDNGIGIAPAYHEKVFGIFEKLDRKIGGVGMGLTMVKRIVETYGGRIWLESGGEGQGCSFRFTLPRAVVGSER